MLFQPNHFELEKFSEIYNIEMSQMRELFLLQDDIVRFQAFEHGVRVETKSGQSLILRLKNKP